jgi:hypothetical protein
MSLPGSDALRIEFRPWPVADRVAAGLVVCCALVVEAVASRYPEPQPGLGVAALLLLAAWLWYRRQRSSDITALEIDPEGRLSTLLADGRAIPSQVLRGTRLLGPTVALRWRAGSAVRHAWLTPWDLPAGQVRELTVRLLANRTRDGA